MGLMVECPECKKRNTPKAKTCKCGVTLGKYSGKAYWIEWYQEGKRRRERIGPNKGAAEHRLREVLSARAEGRHVKKPREAKMTFQDLAKRYHEWSKVNNKSYAVNKHHYINQVTRNFGSRRLADISPWLVEKWKAERIKETGFTELDRELACLKHMFTKAIEWGMMTENPARTVKPFRKTRRRERFLTQAEISRLLDHLPDHQRPVVQLALLTGLRRSNLLNLKWEQLNLHQGLLIIPAQEAKGGRDLKLPLAPAAVELLKWGSLDLS
jgi:integrase